MYTIKENPQKIVAHTEICTIHKSQEEKGLQKLLLSHFLWQPNIHKQIIISLSDTHENQSKLRQKIKQKRNFQRNKKDKAKLEDGIMN